MILLLCLLLWFQHVSCHDDIAQSPASLGVSEGEPAKMDCVQTGKIRNNMVWYLQQHGGGLTQISSVYLNSEARMEESFKGRFVVNRTMENKKSTLGIHNVKREDAAVYFCGATDGRRNSNSEAYFGSGTKLVVIDPKLKLRSPQVTILQPSDREIKNKGKATVVCLITDFYPDNIKIQWFVDDVGLLKNSPNIHTDPSSQSEDGGKTFSISSRLRLDARDYAKAKKVVCQVDHYRNGSTPQIEQETHIIKHETCGLSKEAKVQTMQTAKLTYLILICKSILYGIIVSVLACKAKTSYNKRFD